MLYQLGPSPTSQSDSLLETVSQLWRTNETGNLCRGSNPDFNKSLTRRHLQVPDAILGALTFWVPFIVTVLET